MNLTKKEKTRLLKNKTEDFHLSPLHTFNFEEKLKTFEAQKNFYIQTQAFIRRRKPQDLKPPSKQRFDQLLDPTKKILSNLFSFLPLSSVFSLMRTCKKLKELLSELWKALIEKKLALRLSSEILFSNPDYMRNLYTSLHFPLEQESLLSSQFIFNMAKRTTKLHPPELELQVLMFHLVDFQEIKSQDFIAGINYYPHNYAYPTFMLSFEPDQGHITLWLLAEKHGRLIPTTLWKYTRPQNKEILSVKFQTEEYLLIQTREETENAVLLEIEVFELASLLSQTNISSDSHSRITLQYQNLESEVFVFKSQEGMTAYFEGLPPCGAFMNVYAGERMFFYTKENKVIFALNLHKKVLETVFPISFTEELQSLIIPRNQNKENYVSIFAIETNARISILDYDTESLQYNSKSFFESMSGSQIEGGPQNYQAGSFIDHKGELHEYLIMFKDNTFYHIDLKLQTISTIIRVAPNKKVEHKSVEKERILRKEVSNWTVFEDVIAIILANEIVYICRFTSDGQRALERTKFLPLKKEMARKVKPVEVYLNHCYLMVIQFDSDNYFSIFTTSTQGLLTSKRQETSEIKSNPKDFDVSESSMAKKGVLNWEAFFGGIDEVGYVDYDMTLHQADWEVQTQMNSENSKRVDLFSRFYVGETLDEVKFQGNSMLVYRKGFNIFLNFQSKMNFHKGDGAKFMVTKAYHGRFLVQVDEKEKDLIVPQIKNPHTRLCDNSNTVVVVQEDREESKDMWDQKFVTEEEEKKGEKRKLIKKMINPREKDRLKEVNEFVRLSGRKRKSKVGELVLRKIHQIKDSEKNKRRDQGMMKKSY